MVRHKDFGVALKAHRIASNQPLEDIAAAVELNIVDLKKYEAGLDLPDEHTLQALLRFYVMREAEAMRLWRLAGYAEDQLRAKLSPSQKIIDRQVSVEANTEPLNTDIVHILTSEKGVVISFIASEGNGDSQNVVSQIGLSYRHAMSLIEALKRSINDLG